MNTNIITQVENDFFFGSLILEKALKKIGAAPKTHPSIAGELSRLIQKIHYLIHFSKGKVVDGVRYVYLTAREVSENVIACLEKSSAYNRLNKLVQMNVLTRRQLDAKNLKMKNYYALNYEKIQEILQKAGVSTEELVTPETTQSSHFQPNGNAFPSLKKMHFHSERKHIQDPLQDSVQDSPPLPPQGEKERYDCNFSNYKAPSENSNTSVPLSNKSTKSMEETNNTEVDQSSGGCSISSDLSTTSNNHTTSSHKHTKEVFNITKHPCWDAQNDDIEPGFLEFCIDAYANFSLCKGDRVMAASMVRASFAKSSIKLKAYWKTYQAEARKRLKNAALRTNHGIEIAETEQPKLMQAMQVLGQEEVIEIAKAAEQPKQVESSEERATARQKVREAAARLEQIKQEQEQAKIAQKALQQKAHEQQQELENQLQHRKIGEKVSATEKLEDEVQEAAGAVDREPQDKIKYWAEKLNSSLQTTVATAVIELRKLGCKVIASENGQLDIQF